MLTPLETEMLHLLEMCRGLVPEQRVEAMIDLVQHGEPGVALEMLCDNLDDAGAPLDDTTLATIERLGTQMHLKPDYWVRLRRTPYR